MYVANNVMVEQCTCFLSWAQVLDYLVSLPFLQSPSPARLLALVEAALAATVEAGFEGGMKPKQHWTLHYSDCFRRWLQLPACWALERKHKTPRKFGGTHCKLSTYEKGIMAATTMEHISILATNADLFNTDCHLVDPRTPSKKLENILKCINALSLGWNVQILASCKMAQLATLMMPFSFKNVMVATMIFGDVVEQNISSMQQAWCFAWWMCSTSMGQGQGPKPANGHLQATHCS